MSELSEAETDLSFEYSDSETGTTPSRYSSYDSSPTRGNFRHHHEERYGSHESAYDHTHADREAIAHAQLAAETPPMAAIGEKVGEMLSNSVRANDIGAKVGQLLEARGGKSRRDDARAVLDELNQLQGAPGRDQARPTPEEELVSDSQPVGEHDDWHRQLQAEVAGYGRESHRENQPPVRQPRQRMMVSQSPEQELASESYLEREPDPTSSARGFLAEFRSSSRDATKPSDAARSWMPVGPEEQPAGDGQKSDRTVLPPNATRQTQRGGRNSTSGDTMDVRSSAERRSESGSQLQQTGNRAKDARGVPAVDRKASEEVSRLRTERDAAVEKMRVMEERQKAFVDAQERDLLAIEKRSSTQAEKIKKLAQENAGLRAELEEYRSDLGEAQSGAEGALAQQARGHERQIKALKARLAEAEDSATLTAKDASAKLARSQAQLGRELERLQKNLEDEKQEALALAMEEADERVTDLSAQLRSAERTIEKLENRLQQQDELVAGLDAEKASLEQSLLAAEGQRDVLQRRAESVLAKLEAKDGELVAQAQAADDDVADLATSLEKAQQQEERLTKILDERESEVDDLRRELSDTQAELSASKAAAEENSARLLQMIATKDADACRAAAEADSATESLSTQLHESRIEVSRQRAIVEDKSAALAAVTGERDKLRMELSQSEARLSERNARVQSTEQQLEEATARANSESERAMRNHNEVAMLGKRLEQSHKDLSTAREQQLAAQRTVTELQLQNEALEVQARARAQNHAQDQETLKQLHKAAEAMQNSLAEKTAQCTAAEQAADAQRSSLLQIRAAGEEALARAAADGSRVETLEREISSVRQQLSDASASVERSRKEIQHLTIALDEARYASDELLRRATTAERSADDARREVISMTAEVQKLRALVASHSPRTGRDTGSRGMEFIESGAMLPDPSFASRTGHGQPAPAPAPAPAPVRASVPAPEPEASAMASQPVQDRYAGRWKAVDQNRSSLEIGFAFGHDADDRQQQQQQQQQQQRQQQAAGASTWVPGGDAQRAAGDDGQLWEDARYKQIRQSQQRAAPPWGDTADRTAEEQFGGALHRGSRGMPLSFTERGVDLPVAGKKSQATTSSVLPMSDLEAQEHPPERTALGWDERPLTGNPHGQYSNARDAATTATSATAGDDAAIVKIHTPANENHDAEPDMTTSIGLGEKAREAVKARELAAEVERLRQADEERERALAVALANSTVALEAASAERTVSSRADAYDRASKALAKATAITAATGPSPRKVARAYGNSAHEYAAHSGMVLESVGEADLVAKAAHSTDKLPYATEEHRGPGGGQATVIEIETKYTELCMEKTTLEAEQARLGRSLRDRLRRQEVEKRMTDLAKEIALQRSKLRDAQNSSLSLA